MTEMGMNARFEITQVIIPGWQSGKNISEVNKMREGIHPKYYQAKVTCNCGNEFVTGSTKLSVIHSTQASRKLLLLADVLISSIVSMASNRHN